MSISRVDLHAYEELSSSSDSFAVQTYSSDEFSSELNEVSDCHNFHDRMQRFRDAFSFIPDSDDGSYHHAFIEYSERYLSVIMLDGEYDSNAVVEGELFPKQNAYHHIKIFDDEEHKTILAHLIFDREGKYGELIHVQRGNDFSGTEVKSFVFSIIDALKIERVILHDTAKFTVLVPDVKHKNSQRSVEVTMSMYLPICTQEGKTWYGKDGFSPLACEELKMPQKGVTACQNPEKYRSSVEALRSYELAKLFTIFSKRCDLKKNASILYCLAYKYLLSNGSKATIKTDKEKNEFLAEKTLTDLGQKIKQKNNAEDLALFYTHVLPTSDISKPSKELKTYLALGDDLQAVHIWEKRFV